MKLSKKKIKIFISLCIGFLASGSAISICFPKVIIILLLFINILLFPKNFNEIIKLNKKCIEIDIFFILILLTFIFNFSILGISLWIKLFLILLLNMQLLFYLKKYEMIRYYLFFMEWISKISLVGYLLFVILKLPVQILPIISKVTNLGDKVQYYSIGIFNIWIAEFKRNCGIFWEPSIFAAYLIIGLIFTILYVPKVCQKKYFFLFGLTLLSTKSTGGYLLSSLVFIFYLLKNKKYFLFKLFIFLIFFIMVIMFKDEIKYFFLHINYDIFSKIIFYNSKGTTITRGYSILINSKIWLKNGLIFGVGLIKQEILYEYYKTIYAPLWLNPAQTSTTTLMISCFGIGGFYYLYLWFKSIFKLKELKIINRLLLFIILLFILNQTPHTYFFLTYYSLFLLLKKEKMEGKNE